MRRVQSRELPGITDFNPLYSFHSFFPHNIGCPKLHQTTMSIIFFLDFW